MRALASLFTIVIDNLMEERQQLIFVLRLRVARTAIALAAFASASASASFFTT